MIDITLQNFEAEVLQASLKQPVLLDIWAPWCGPCRTLGPILEALEAEYGGRFVLGKLNADEQQEIAGQLSAMFGVRSIPFCVLFKDGQPVDGFVGALPRERIQQFLDKHVPAEAQLAADEAADEAGLLADEGNVDAALERLQEAIAIDPSNDAARLDYVKLLLQAGRTAEARVAYEPVAGKALGDTRVAAFGQWIEACEKAATARPVEALQAAIAANKRDFEARFELAQRLFAAQQWTAAMDELLEIIMRDKKWNDEAPRKAYVAILELMAKPAPRAAEPAPQSGTLEIAGKAVAAPADPVIDQYRRKLSMALF
ncbi:tetratricopeptide repeat protein [Caldimonas thermodepolymerans]|uniref:tetratricopeptide repeat protein n=1 Tax=Caldimonas thermodepolymerans TaxID=215580 RepID=UPI002235CF92|nr:tetratricopeptide repeat protein [Caldimonas thermodepolymerans]UZG45030.1 tetratricopeptide repeat protein [Caldimonas thermodepolymerans]